MDRLILMRHGKAERHAAQGGDFERALAERGRQDVALIASALAAEDLSPDLVLVSAARRTRETWDAARCCAISITPRRKRCWPPCAKPTPRPAR